MEPEYKDLTDEEYDALDEYYTKNPPKLSGNGKSGFFAKRAEKGSTLIFVDDLSAEEVMTAGNGILDKHIAAFKALAN